MLVFLVYISVDHTDSIIVISTLVPECCLVQESAMIEQDCDQRFTPRRDLVPRDELTRHPLDFVIAMFAVTGVGMMIFEQLWASDATRKLETAGTGLLIRFGGTILLYALFVMTFNVVNTLRALVKANPVWLVLLILPGVFVAVELIMFLRV